MTSCTRLVYLTLRSLALAFSAAAWGAPAFEGDARLDARVSLEAPIITVQKALREIGGQYGVALTVEDDLATDWPQPPPAGGARAPVVQTAGGQGT